MTTNFIITASEPVTTLGDWFDFLHRAADSGASKDAEIANPEGEYLVPEITWRET